MKKNICFFFAMTCFLLLACSAGETPNAENESKENGAFTEVTYDTQSYFKDESVKFAVETYFEKEAADLTEDDFATLSNLLYFSIDLPINSVDDILRLFPNLKYLDIIISPTASKDICNTLKGMDSLKAVSVNSSILLDTEFTKNLSYIEITYNENIYLSKYNNLADFSPLGSEYIKEHMASPIQTYVCIYEEEQVFELCASGYTEYEEDSILNPERKVFVSKKKYKKTTNIDVLDFSAIYGMDVENKLQLIDLDFDGVKDILVDDGLFGNQALTKYTCFLNTNNQYSKCDSFSDIPNPMINTERKKIQGTWRNWAASHSKAMFSYENGAFIMTDCLTEEVDLDSPSNEDIWVFTVEKMVDGKMKKTERYSTDNLTREQIEDILYAENSDWGLYSDQWHALYTTWYMDDFSIDGNCSINPTIYDIVYDI